MRRYLTTLRAALVVATVFTAIPTTQAATFKPIAHGKSLVMTGESRSGDVQRLWQAATAAERKYGYDAERIFLNSDGGNVMAGLEVADFIQRWGIHTVVGKTDTCASICVAIFAAGSHKVVFTTSNLGVHSASTIGKLGEVVPFEAPEATLILARIYRNLGVPDTVIGKMVATPANDIAWLHDGDWPGVEVLPQPMIALILAFAIGGVTLAWVMLLLFILDNRNQ